MGGGGGETVPIHLLYFLGESISYRAASFLALLYEWLRQLTDQDAHLLAKVAHAQFVETVLYSLRVLARSTHYNKVSYSNTLSC